MGDHEMRLDLISALEGSISEQPSVEGAESGSGDEFPNVLRSTLDEVEQARRGETPDETASTDSASDVAREGNQDESGSAAREGSRENGPETSDSSSNPEPETREANGQDEAVLPDEVVDTAGLGAVASVLVSQTRTGQSIESATGNDGSISVLDVEGTDGDGPAQGRTELAREQRTHADVGRVAAGERVDVEVREALGLPTASAGEATERAREAGEVTERVGAPPNGAGERAQGNPRLAKAVRNGAPETGPPAARLETNDTPVAGPIGSIESRADGEAPSDDRSDSRGEAHAEARAETRRAGEDAKNEQALIDRAAENTRLEGVEAGVKVEESHAEVSLRAPEVVPVSGVGQVANPVAGMVTEMTTTAAPGSPAPAAASDAIAVQTEWLASRGGGSARLLLNPPDLGEIAIRVTLREGAVDVVMVAHEAAARSVAEDQSDRLVQAFANRDLRMETFEVRRGDPTEMANLDLSHFGDSGPRGRDRAEDETDGRGAPSRRGGAIGRGAGPDPVRSVQPEILSVGQETGVDLRI